MSPWPEHDPARIAQLPAPLDAWAAELLAAPPPNERHATCDRCAMCASPGGDAPPPQRVRFSPQVRCCTYRPQLVNHLLGRLLAVEPVATTLAARLSDGETTPLGLRVAPAYQLLYRHASAQSFGRAESLRCPHVRDDGRCDIWSARPAVCATWFCKHERGALGGRLWTSLRDCFVAAERALALWCLGELGLGGTVQREALAAWEQDRFDPDALDGRSDPENVARLWGEWAGREVAFYRACADAVAGLGWADVERIGGSELASLAARAREASLAHEDLSLPAGLATGRFSVTGSHQGRVCLQTYSEFDPLEVSPDVLALVARCDGGSPDEVAEAHAAAGGRRPDRRLLRTLVDFGVLQPAAPAASAGPAR